MRFKLADLVITKENPLANFKVLYGTGHFRLDADNRPVRVGDPIGDRLIAVPPSGPIRATPLP